METSLDHYADGGPDIATVNAGRVILSRQDLVKQRPDLPAFLREMTGLPIASAASCQILGLANCKRMACFALHNVTPTGEAELVAAVDRGLLQRSSLRFLAHWIFGEFGVRRLVCRIPADNQPAQDYARRLGFKFEGKAKSYFADDTDASVWVMFAHTCPWLRG
ncbi:GNAT family N-acetyltransferase [Bosea sp. PAMC 26642]|uniref:GNAT family N-acetyltransferase n=1 Tax=Bosea sp. (strain PAMC 26642) TaxID=1792307 RepID=UPI00076FEEF4|nr:GNAT family protein [Bosea sp. PAMC 26642]AMJ61986.1 hypothetical protein AXW83_18270 [Bosea sp. PAMC 26642]